VSLSMNELSHSWTFSCQHGSGLGKSRFNSILEKSEMHSLAIIWKFVRRLDSLVMTVHCATIRALAQSVLNL
jgi:hypothetical protein